MALDFVETTISRTELALGDLNINPADGYYIARNGIGPGGLQHEKIHATSPFVDGAFLTHKRREMQIIPLKINVRGVSASQLHGRIATLCEAFEQFQYSLTVTIDDITYQWTCETADYEVGDGGAWDDMMIRSFYQTISLEVPRFPG